MPRKLPRKLPRKRLMIDPDIAMDTIRLGISVSFRDQYLAGIL